MNLAGLWEKAVTNGGVIQGAYDWQRFLSEAPNPESPDAAREFSLRMRLCITDALLNRGNEIVLEPVVGSPPVLYELPMADFSITSTSWAIGNYQTPGKDAASTVGRPLLTLWCRSRCLLRADRHADGGGHRAGNDCKSDV